MQTQAEKPAAPNAPWTHWEMHQAITSRNIFFVFIFTLFLMWSGHNTEMDKAFVETGKAVASTVGIGDSNMLSGAGRFASQAFPIMLETRDDVARIVDFDAKDLPWLAYLEKGEERSFNAQTMQWTIEETQYVVDPMGYLKKVLWKMWETIEMGFWGTFLAFLLSVPLGIMATRNYAPHPVVYHSVRTLLSFQRAMPELIVALFLVLIYGFGPIAGVFALAIHTSGVLAKFFADEIENAPKGPQMALKSAGNSTLKVLRYSVIPHVLPSWVAYVQYIFERNIRTATVLGIVGAGGIGMELKGRWDLFDYSHVATILLVIFLTVYVLELASQRLRARMM